MSKYLIKKDTLTDIANSMRAVLHNNTFNPDYIIADGYFETGRVEPYYKEFIDVEDVASYANGIEPDRTYYFTRGVYLPNDKNIMVPVMYDDHSDDTEDEHGNIYYYEGPATVPGDEQIYDKWRQIEANDNLTWDSVGKIYVYTTKVINTDYISPSDFSDKVYECYNEGLNNGGGGGSTSDMTSTGVYVTSGTPTNIKFNGWIFTEDGYKNDSGGTYDIDILSVPLTSSGQSDIHDWADGVYKTSGGCSLSYQLQIYDRYDNLFYDSGVMYAIDEAPSYETTLTIKDNAIQYRIAHYSSAPSGCRYVCRISLYTTIPLINLNSTETSVYDLNHINNGPLPVCKNYSNQTFVAPNDNIKYYICGNGNSGSHELLIRE